MKLENKKIGRNDQTIVRDGYRRDVVPEPKYEDRV